MVRTSLSGATASALFLTLALAGCGTGTEPDEPGPPGVVSYRLTSPHGAEGALLFVVPAAEVLSVGEGDVLTEVLKVQTPADLYVAVVHRFGVENLGVELEVADSDAPPRLELLRVVGPANQERALAGYALEPVQ